MVDHKTFHYLISGRVQGVFFRQSTQEKAVELNLKGWVRNLNNGQVEVLAYGSTQKLTLFKQWLEQGPPTAKVDSVKESPSEEKVNIENSFSIVS